MKTPPPYALDTAHNGSGIGQILLLVLLLAVLLALVYYTTRFVGRFAARGSLFAPGKDSEFRPGRHIALIDRLAVDREKAVLLVRVDRAYYLLGVSEESVRLLKEVEPPPAEAAQDAPGQGAGGFKGLLDMWKGRGGAPGPEDAAEGAREG